MPESLGGVSSMPIKFLNHLDRLGTWSFATAKTGGLSYPALFATRHSIINI